MEEIIVLLFLAAARLKRRAAAEEEKKARVVVVGTKVILVFVFSKDDDDAFGGDVVSAGDGADERRCPTALCIFFRVSAKKLPSFFVSKLTFFLKLLSHVGEKKCKSRAHMSRMCISSTLVIRTSFLGDIHTHTRARALKRRFAALFVCCYRARVIKAPRQR